MTNFQCYCYGVIAIHNVLKDTLPITADLFYEELYYLWDLYSEEAIEKLYRDMENKGHFKKLENMYIKIKDWS